MSAATLFVDLDGVVHPAEVYVTPRGIALEAPGHQLFEHLPLLEAVVAGFPRLDIVLSTQWAAVTGYRATRARLPLALRKRVVAATTFGVDPRVWRKQSRYEQIVGYVARNRIVSWVAIDDDARGWPEEQRQRLVLTDGATGMTTADADELVRRLGTLL